MREVSVSRLIDQINALPPLKRKAVLAGIVGGPQPLKATKGQKELVWHGLPVFFVPGEYLSNPQQMWQLESILGLSKLMQVLKRTRLVLESQTIERLFEESALELFTNSEETYLFSARNELTEADFGPLQSINALDALKKFGLEYMETAKDKGYVRLQKQ